MKKLLILLAVATLPSASGCCCARLCPCCPCNWFNRPATYCCSGLPAAYAAPTYVPSTLCRRPVRPYSPCAPLCDLCAEHAGAYGATGRCRNVRPARCR